MGEVKRFAVALTLATLFFGQQIVSWSDPTNRYLYHWRGADTAYLIGAVLLTGLLASLVDLAGRHLASPEARRWLRLAFVLVLGQLVIAIAFTRAGERPFEGATIASLAAAGLVILAFRRAESRVVRYAVKLCLIMAPLPLILFAQMLGWKSWRECGELAGVPAAASNVRPVFVLLFDEWSLERSTASSEFLPALARLRRLAETSFVFPNASAPASGTLKSIPRILMGEAGEVVPKNGWAEWSAGTVSVPVEERSNLFRLPSTHGYRTALAGWYLPYAALTGDDLDWCSTYPHIPKRNGAARLLDLLWGNLRHLPDPLSHEVWRTLYARWYSANYLELDRKVQAEAIRLAGHSPANTFALLHFPIPHGPFIFDADGAYRGPFEITRVDGTVAEYTQHLKYLDAVLGRVLDTLEAAGQFDSALVVVTSDHAWKADPDLAARTMERIRRVPLLIKWPGQEVGRTMPTEFCLSSLGSVIEAAIGQRATPKQAQTLLERSGLQGAGRCDEP